MNAQSELANYLQHYGRDGIQAMIEELESMGYEVNEPVWGNNDGFSGDDADLYPDIDDDEE